MPICLFACVWIYSPFALGYGVLSESLPSCAIIYILLHAKCWLLCVTNLLHLAWEYEVSPFLLCK
ncbi:hypothetical protein SLEP1_g15013 [Rubroshorea leprosula]|uniref:NADH dehydrogenase subunit 4 n=1 Tax=Rubroshorea leprosula TaxID=152421 RepID=A0AAV5IV08_9ROSI|nr:hypothetical protein SLEP1_g15013 [Rubroshorea leprosula]